MLSTRNQFDYDRKLDVLYCTLGDTSNSYGDEQDDNVVLLRDINTDQVTGITVLDFKKSYPENSLIGSVLQKFFNLDDILSIAKQI